MTCYLTWCSESCRIFDEGWVVLAFAPLLSHAQGFDVEPAVGVDRVDRSLAHFLPILVSDRFGGHEHGPVSASRVMVHVWETANLAIENCPALEVIECAAAPGSDQIMAIRQHDVQADLPVRCGLAAPPDNVRSSQSNCLRERAFRRGFYPGQDEVEEMLAVGLPLDRVFMVQRGLFEEVMSDGLETRQGAIVGECPVLVHEGMSVDDVGFTDRRCAYVGDDDGCVDPRCGALEMFAVICRPGLAFDMRMGVLISSDTPAVDMAGT